MHNLPPMAVLVRRRRDGLTQILPPPFRRDVREPFPESFGAFLLGTGLYVATFIPGKAELAIVAACLGLELWRAYRARKLLERPLAEVQEFPARRRAC